MRLKYDINIPFQVGDLVFHHRMDDDSPAPSDYGVVWGFCPGPNWIRVKTHDGKYRIWAKGRVVNVDFDMQMGRYEDGKRLRD